MITWRKSTHSDETGGHCVELAAFPHAVAVRDSKAPDAGHLTLTPRTFADLLSRVKRDSLPR
jgi:xanthine/CO dehydrogenase XdhC/CoxF family maturation factor